MQIESLLIAKNRIKFNILINPNIGAKVQNKITTSFT